MDLEKIKNAKWYKQGSIAIPWFIHDPYVGSMDILGEDEIITYSEKNNIGYLNKEKQIKKANEILKKRNIVEHILEMKKEWKKSSKEFFKTLKFNFSELSNEEFVLKIKEIGKNNIKSWSIPAIIECFDPWGEEIIEKQMERAGVFLREEDLIASTSPEELNLMQREKIDRLKIKNKEDLEKHKEKYFYILNGWGKAEELDEKYFEELLKENNSKQVQEILDGFEKRKKRKKELKEKLDDELFQTLDLFSKLAQWREERKKRVMLANHYLWKILKEISKRTGVSIELLEFLTSKEVEIPISKEKIKELNERRKLSVFIKNYGWFYKGKAEEIIKTIEQSLYKKEIRGNIACKGKAVGKVRLIKSYEDFEKMENGDILVTVMTRPEYLPAIKKAGAVVADEGGITCHAAIVSRELNIPCIVGTQVATHALKDGDLIEVDANKGIVKIIEKDNQEN